MKIWIRSDLHLQNTSIASVHRLQPPHDVQILAGDISGAPAGVVAALDACVSRPTVCVAGNHEFYHRVIGTEIIAARRAAELSGHVHFLENDAVVVDGVRLLGCTLWSDFDIEGAENRELSMRAAQAGMNDFHLIHTAIWRPSKPAPRFTPYDARALHLKSRAWLENQFAEPFEGPTVVVTHHAPHRGSIHEAYEGDPTNGGFVSDLEDEILRWQPALWIHGHVHNRFDYRVSRTRIICNPAGYGSEDTDYDGQLVIELDDLESWRR